MDTSFPAESRQEFLERQPTYWLKRTFQAMRRRVDSELRPYGVNLSQRDTLLTLSGLGPKNQGELVQILGLEQSTVSRLMDGLQTRGWVQIREGERDRRARVIEISEAGRRILQETPGSSRLAGSVIADAVGADEMPRFIELLRRCAVALEDGGRFEDRDAEKNSSHHQETTGGII